MSDKPFHTTRGRDGHVHWVSPETTPETSEPQPGDEVIPTLPVMKYERRTPEGIHFVRDENGRCWLPPATTFAPAPAPEPEGTCWTKINHFTMQRYCGRHGREAGWPCQVAPAPEPPALLPACGWSVGPIPKEHGHVCVCLLPAEHDLPHKGGCGAWFEGCGRPPCSETPEPPPLPTEPWSQRMGDDEVLWTLAHGGWWCSLNGECLTAPKLLARYPEGLRDPREGAS